MPTSRFHLTRIVELHTKLPHNGTLVCPTCFRNNPVLSNIPVVLVCGCFMLPGTMLYVTDVRCKSDSVLRECYHKMVNIVGNRDAAMTFISSMHNPTHSTITVINNIVHVAHRFNQRAPFPLGPIDSLPFYFTGFTKAVPRFKNFCITVLTDEWDPPQHVGLGMFTRKSTYKYILNANRSVQLHRIVRRMLSLPGVVDVKPITRCRSI